MTRRKLKSKKKRFLAAVRGEVPDIVPVAPLIHNRFAHRITGRTGWKAVFEVHKLVGSIYFRGPLTLPYQFKIRWNQGWGERSGLLDEREGRRVYKHVIETPCGCLTSKVIDGMIPDDPTVKKTVEYYVKTEEDYETYRNYLDEWHRRAEADLAEVQIACKAMGDEGVPSLGAHSIFNTLGMVRGMRDLLLDLYRRPVILNDIFDLLQQVKVKEIEAFLDSPSEVLYYDTCWACDISPHHFREWVLPDLKRVSEMVRKEDGKYVGFYFLGKMRSIMPLILEARPHFVETFENLRGDLSLGEAKRLYGKRICLMGNYNPIILAEGKPEEARQEALRCLEEGMKGGGYVMVTGDEVPAHAKLENLKIMVNTVEEHGRYY